MMAEKDSLAVAIRNESGSGEVSRETIAKGRPAFRAREIDELIGEMLLVLVRSLAVMLERRDQFLTVIGQG